LNAEQALSDPFFRFMPVTQPLSRNNPPYLRFCQFLSPIGPAVAASRPALRELIFNQSRDRDISLE
jgi:hypothetical protein